MGTGGEEASGRLLSRSSLAPPATLAKLPVARRTWGLGSGLDGQWPWAGSEGGGGISKALGQTWARTSRWQVWSPRVTAGEQWPGESDGTFSSRSHPKTRLPAGFPTPRTQSCSLKVVSNTLKTKGDKYCEDSVGRCVPGGGAVLRYLLNE